MNNSSARLFETSIILSGTVWFFRFFCRLVDILRHDIETIKQKLKNIMLQIFNHLTLIEPPNKMEYEPVATSEKRNTTISTASFRFHVSYDDSTKVISIIASHIIECFVWSTTISEPLTPVEKLKFGITLNQWEIFDIFDDYYNQSNANVKLNLPENIVSKNNDIVIEIVITSPLNNKIFETKKIHLKHQPVPDNVRNDMKIRHRDTMLDRLNERLTKIENNFEYRLSVLENKSKDDCCVII